MQAVYNKNKIHKFLWWLSVMFILHGCSVVTAVQKTPKRTFIKVEEKNSPVTNTEIKPQDSISTGHGQETSYTTGTVLPAVNDSKSDIVLPPVLANGVLLIQSDAQHLIAFDSQTGQRRWVYAIPLISNHHIAAFTADKYSVYVQFKDKRIISLALDSGIIRWESFIDTTPIPPLIPVTAVNPKTTTIYSEDKNITTKKLEQTLFIWPTQHTHIYRDFDQTQNKGILLIGKEGDPILAAAEGKVVYAGNQIPGYGQMIIIRHDDIYLSAYGHNKKLLVKVGDFVTVGQKIAEMGQSDAHQVQLHFEVRKNGLPVDPVKLLPAR